MLMSTISNHFSAFFRVYIYCKYALASSLLTCMSMNCKIFYIIKFVMLESSLMVEAIQKLTEQMSSMNLRMLPLLEFVNYVNVNITPSLTCKSNAEEKNKYRGLMAALQFPVNFSDIIESDMSIVDSDAVKPIYKSKFNFDWNGRSETESYQPLQEFLQTLNIHVLIIGSGSGLPDGLLYNVEIYSLKRDINIISDELRKTQSEPKLLFRLKGRTDLIVLFDPKGPLSDGNIKYFIEIKTVKDFNQTWSLKEAILQLIGGNTAAEYHSPPVLLTNLEKHHYVLYIVKCDTDFLKYELKITKWEKFCAALAFVESRTQEPISVTRFLGRKPTPPSSVVPVETDDVDIENQIEEADDNNS